MKRITATEPVVTMQVAAALAVTAHDAVWYLSV